MGNLVVSDNAATTLAASISNSPSVSSITVTNGGKFPVVNHGGAGTDWSYVTLFDAAGNIETMKVTRHDNGSGSMSVVRGTAAGISGVNDASCLAWASGTTGVACRLIAQTVIDMFSALLVAQGEAIDAAASAASAAVSAAAAAASVSALDAANLLHKTDNLAGLSNTSTARENLGLGNVDNTSDSTKNAAAATLANKTLDSPVIDSKMQVGASGTATNNFTLSAAAADGTLKLARGNQTAPSQDIMTVDAAGKASFPQGIASANSLPAFQCRAWVNFDGSGSVGANQTIRGAGNVASVYKVAVGVFKITFATPMPDANYAVLGLCGNTPAYDRNGVGFVCVSSVSGTPEVNANDVTVITSITANGGPYDQPAKWVSVSIFK